MSFKDVSRLYCVKNHFEGEQHLKDYYVVPPEMKTGRDGTVLVALRAENATKRPTFIN